MSFCRFPLNIYEMIEPYGLEQISSYVKISSFSIRVSMSRMSMKSAFQNAILVSLSRGFGVQFTRLTPMWNILQS